ncbi:MAG: phage holin family protein [Gammaproteobacteria bacterium]
MVGFIFRAVIAAAGLWLATLWVNGIWIDSPLTLVLAGALLGIVNAFVRPIAVILTFPFTIFTLGLFLLVVNAGMLALVAVFLPGFRIDGFWAAVWAALIVSVTGWIGSALIGSNAKVEIYRRNG